MHNPVLNKTMNTHEKYIKHNFGASLSKVAGLVKSTKYTEFWQPGTLLEKEIIVGVFVGAL